MDNYQKALDYINKSVCTLLALRGIQDEQVTKNLHILQEAVNKTNKLDKLEKELSCTFETIIEATTNGIIDSKGKEHEIVFDNYYLYVVEEDELIDRFDFKDYKKTWWLPSDKE